MRATDCSSPHTTKDQRKQFCTPHSRLNLCQHQERGFIAFRAACRFAPHRDNRNYYSISEPVFLPDTPPSCSPPDRVLNQLSAGGLLTAAAGSEAACQAQLTASPATHLCKKRTLHPPPQLLSNPERRESHSPDKNLLHLLQPVHLLHPVCRGTEDKDPGGWGTDILVWQEAGSGACPRPLLQAPVLPTHQNEDPSLAQCCPSQPCR